MTGSVPAADRTVSLHFGRRPNLAGTAEKVDACFEHVRKHSGEKAAEVCRKALQAFQNPGRWIYWGRGAVYPSFVPIYSEVRKRQLGAFYSYIQTGTIETYLKYFKEPYDQEEKQKDLQQESNAIAGIDIPDDKLLKCPSFDCTVLVERSVTDPEEIKKFADLGYRYSTERPTENNYTYVKGEI